MRNLAGVGLKSFQGAREGMTRRPEPGAANVGEISESAPNSWFLLIFYTGSDLARRLLKARRPSGYTPWVALLTAEARSVRELPCFYFFFCPFLRSFS